MSKAIFKKRKFSGDFRAVKKLTESEHLLRGRTTKGDRSYFGNVNHYDDSDMMKVVITDIEPFSENVKRYRFEPQDFDLPFFEAGQSVCVFMRINGGRYLKPLAVSSSPNRKYYSVIVFRDDFVADRILDDWVVGSEVTITRPRGNFTYHPLRDEKTVLAFADGIGISHFISMAEAIVEGKEDFNLFVVYVVDYYKEIIFKNYLSWLENNSDGKVKFCFLLGEESRIGCRHGYVTSSLIKSLVEPPYSVFAVGSSGLIKRLETHLAKLEIDDKHYHKRIPFVYAKQEDKAGKAYARPVEYTLTVRSGEAVYPPIKVEKGDTLMVAMEKAGLNVPGKCMTGECGLCCSRLISGEIEMINDQKREVTDVKYSVIHPCACYPVTDVEIEIPIKRNEL